MRLTLLRSFAAAAALGLLTTVGVSAMVRYPVHTGMQAPMVKHVAPFLYAPHHINGCSSSGSTPDFICTSTFKGSPSTEGICITDVSPPSCASSGLAPGSWTWSATPYKSCKTTKKGQKCSAASAKDLTATFSPNPGNPITETFTTRSKAVKQYQVFLTACNSSSSCAAGWESVVTNESSSG